MTLFQIAIHPYIRAFAKSKEGTNTRNLAVKFSIHYGKLLKHLTEKCYSKDFQVAVKEIRLEKPNIIKMLMSFTEESNAYEAYRVLADKFFVRFIYMFIPAEHYISFYTIIRNGKKAGRSDDVFIYLLLFRIS